MLLWNRKIRVDQKVFLFRTLSYLLTPDYSIAKAIEFLRDDLDNKKLDKILLSLQQDFERGLSLSESAGKYPSLFSEPESKLIEIGEKAETLPKIFENLAEDNERKNFVDKVWKRLLRSVLFYIVPVGLLIFLFSTFVIPVYGTMFAGFGSTLPLPTRIVVEASQKWSLMVYFIIFGGLVVYLKKRVRYIESAIDFTVLHFPVIGYVHKQIAIDSLIRTLTILISNHTAAGETVRLAAMALDNRYLSKKVLKFSELADIENKVSAALRQCNFIPRRLVRIITAAEQRDGDPAILEFARNFYSEQTLESIINAQEKLMIFMRVIFGVIIGFIAIALYLPLFSIGSLIG